MCGIAGVLVGSGSVVDDDGLRAVAAALVHRGPDGEGFHVEGPIGLAHRRLAIIDVAGGVQPMFGAAGRVVGVVNGEIYNYRQLRERLRALGHVFATDSDSEVVIHGYAAWGDEVLDHLEGQFAFAVWDARTRRLLLARDRMGEKPLFWAPLPDGGLAFASELRALRRYPGVDSTIDPAALARYLVYEYVPAPRSMCRGIRKLAAGHCLVAQPGAAARVHPYFELPLAPHPVGGRLDDLDIAAADVRAALDRSIRARLVSDVPLGVFLSGGLDSSLVTALASRARGGDLDAFTIAFDEPSYDESVYARRAADHIGCRHHVRTVRARDVLELVPRLGALLDEPFGDGSLIPTHLLSRFAREHVTVALGGDGADELFGGYPTFQAEAVSRFTEHLPRPAAGWLARGARALTDRLPVSTANFSLDFKLRQFSRGLEEEGPRRHQAWLASLLPREVAELLLPEVARAAEMDPPSRLYDAVDRSLARCSSDDRWDRLLAFYTSGYLADDMLVKVDRASMATSLEVRAPMLSREMVSLACRLEPSLRVRGGDTKRVIKRAARGLVPDELIDRSKHGFGMPVATWLRGELRDLLEDTLSERRLREANLLRPAAVRRLVEDHVAGRANHRKPLWTLLALELWRTTKT
jgi:asparagine synthase (glutamine-hydrolysing)